MLLALYKSEASAKFEDELFKIVNQCLFQLDSLYFVSRVKPINSAIVGFLIYSNGSDSLKGGTASGNIVSGFIR